ncbi:hypothetical protein E2C01_017712 [Portunus trituberculatus]|uniref:Uncharacterized protein n=1 Tax=Portunus trituberculatus TaxID=210409 RepID=A0A5B7DUJ8_PORTR|nr:hypothetical protein [Portunus trituberculatus]
MSSPPLPFSPPFHSCHVIPFTTSPSLPSFTSSPVGKEVLTPTPPLLTAHLHPSPAAPSKGNKILHGHSYDNSWKCLQCDT